MDLIILVTQEIKIDSMGINNNNNKSGISRNYCSWCAQAYRYIMPYSTSYILSSINKFLALTFCHFFNIEKHFFSYKSYIID